MHCKVVVRLAQFIALTGILLTPIRIWAAASGPPFDLRVLIDESGSMKKTDPLNLRVPALKLLAELLPPEGQGSVWGFAQGAEQLVASGATSKAWKTKAVQVAGKVHSRGLFTDIEQVVKKASADWQRPGDGATQRQLLLLTDGMVDVSKDPAANAASQQRILEELVPQLQKAGVKIHTIALSDGADAALLEQLAVLTGGSFEQAATAEELQRVFLHMFERAAPRDTLPLTENKFHVDSSVNEFTLLVFRKNPDAATTIVGPDRSKVELGTERDGVRWHREAQYDLVTIEKPVAGEWQVNADIDPDNRVMVVSNLKLKVSDIPNNLIAGEQPEITASLTAGDDGVKRADFLKLVKFTGRVQPSVDGTGADKLDAHNAEGDAGKHAEHGHDGQGKSADVSESKHGHQSEHGEASDVEQGDKVVDHGDPGKSMDSKDKSHDRHSTVAGDDDNDLKPKAKHGEHGTSTDHGDEPEEESAASEEPAGHAVAEVHGKGSHTKMDSEAALEHKSGHKTMQAAAHSHHPHNADVDEAEDPAEPEAHAKSEPKKSTLKHGEHGTSADHGDEPEEESVASDKPAGHVVAEVHGKGSHAKVDGEAEPEHKSGTSHHRNKHLHEDASAEEESASTHGQEDDAHAGDESTAMSEAEKFQFDGPTAEGIYAAELPESLVDGRNDIVVTAKSATFERERRISVTFHAHPVSVKVKAVGTAGSGTYDVSFTPKPGLLNLDGARLIAHVMNASGKDHKVEAKAPDEQGWTIKFQGLQNGTATVKGEIRARSAGGEKVRFETETVELGGTPPVQDPTSESDATAGTAPESGTNVNWLRSAGIVAAANLLFGACIYGAIIWMRKRFAATPALERAL